MAASLGVSSVESWEGGEKSMLLVKNVNTEAENTGEDTAD
jgi:hypothetical protein